MWFFSAPSLFLGSDPRLKAAQKHVYLWLGTLPDGRPIPWRLLSRQGNGGTYRDAAGQEKTGALFLLCGMTLGTYRPGNEIRENFTIPFHASAKGSGRRCWQHIKATERIRSAGIPSIQSSPPRRGFWTGTGSSSSATRRRRTPPTASPSKAAAPPGRSGGPGPMRRRRPPWAIELRASSSQTAADC